LDVLATAEEAAGEAEHAPLVGAHDRGERRLVAAAASGDQQLLAARLGGHREGRHPQRAGERDHRTLWLRSARRVRVGGGYKGAEMPVAMSAVRRFRRSGNAVPRWADGEILARRCETSTCARGSIAAF